MSRSKGLVTPESDNARGQAGVIGEQGDPNGAIVAAERQRVTGADALIAECRRRAASKGIAMHVLDGELLFAWAGLCKSLPTPEAAATWLDRCGVPR